MQYNSSSEIIKTTTLDLLTERSEIPQASGFRTGGQMVEVSLAENMRPYMTDIYQHIFPGSTITYTSSSSDEHRNLHDTIMGIDIVITHPAYGTITIQEKVRDWKFYRYIKYHESRDACPDYCLEWSSSGSHDRSEAMNGIAAYTMLAFAGYEYDDIACWALIDNSAVKRKIAANGIDSLGSLHQNIPTSQGGSGTASFYAISLYNISDAIVYSNFYIDPAARTFKIEPAAFAGEGGELK